MANDTIITVVGNTTADAELRYTQAGVPVATFTVASTPRKFNKQTNEWEDQEALFLRCSAWRELAEHIAASITKGTRVVVQGNLKQRSYQDKEGANRVSIELEVEEIGPSLRYATAQVTKAQSGQQGQQRGGQQQQGGQPGGAYGAPQQAAPQGAYGAPQQGGYQQAPQQTQQPGQAQPGSYGDDTPW